MTFKCYVIKEGTPQKTWRWSPNVFVFHLTLILCFSYSPVCCSKKLPYIFIVNKSVWHSRVWKNMSRRLQHRCSREEESQLLRAACCYAVSFCRISVYAHKNWEWSKDWSFIVKLQAHINSLTVTLWRRNGKPSDDSFYVKTLPSRRGADWQLNICLSPRSTSVWARCVCVCWGGLSPGMFCFCKSLLVAGCPQLATNRVGWTD